jgi:DNA modification methylase
MTEVFYIFIARKILKNVELYNADCLDILPMLNSNSIDLTVTSPPYDNLRTYNNSLVWNSEIWQAVIKELFRITADGGVVVWVVVDATINGSETGTSFKQALYFMECDFKLHDTMIYHKQTLPLTHKRYEQHFEYMFVFVKGKIKTFNPLLKSNISFGSSRNGMCETTKQSREKNSLASKIDNISVKQYGYRGNVWSYPIGYMKSSKDKIAFQHPAIFPEQLATDHVLSWSNEGDVVLDCFMGSGTVGKVAKLHNRNFIGIEKVLKYFEIAQQRIFNSEELMQSRLL